MAANEKYLTSSDVVFWAQYNSTTYSECVAAEARGARIMLSYSYGDLNLEMTGSHQSIYYEFSAVVNGQLFNATLYNNNTWERMPPYYIITGSTAGYITGSNYSNGEVFPSTHALYYYSTGYTMPHPVYLMPNLYVCNGNLIAETGFTSSHTSVTLSTFYAAYMKSLGAYDLAQSGATGSAALNYMRRYFPTMSFMRRRTNATTSSIYRATSFSLGSTTSISAGSSTSAGVTANTSTVSILIA